MIRKFLSLVPYTKSPLSIIQWTLKKMPFQNKWIRITNKKLFEFLDERLECAEFVIQAGEFCYSSSSLPLIMCRKLAPYLSALDVSNSPAWNIENDELDFFPSLKPTGYFFQFKLDFFSSFWARVKYFDGPCWTIFCSLSTIYRGIHYQFPLWWIQ